MTCTPMRLELSNTDATTVDVTITADPGDGVAVVLEVPGLGINESQNTSGAAVSYTLAARTEGTNSLWDGTIQVGTNAPADIAVQIVETSAAQTVGVTVSDADVSYCAPTSGGGGGEALVPVKRLASEDDVQYLFANNPGYVAGSTSAYMVEDAGEKFASPEVDAVNRNADGMQAQLMSWANIAVRGGDEISSGIPPLTTTREIVFTDMFADWGTFNRLNQVSVWGDGSGLGIDTIRSPFLDDLEDEFTSTFWHYSYVLRNQNATQATATINSITESGVDGGTY